MKGMTTSQYVEIVEFVQKYHKFAKWISEDERKKELEIYPFLPEYGYNIKYIDSVYDSRDGGDIWLIKLRGSGNDLAFRTNHFNALHSSEEHKKIPYDNLFDWVMAFLKGEWKNNDVLKDIRTFHDQDRNIPILTRTQKKFLEKTYELKNSIFNFDLEEKIFRNTYGYTKKHVLEEIKTLFKKLLNF